MDLNWLQSILYGLLSGLTDTLPVSSAAHKVLLMKFYGLKGNDLLLVEMLVHLGILGGLYFESRGELLRISRARTLARVPKRRRRRPLDTRSLLDWSMLKTMAIPVVVGLLLYRYVSHLKTNPMALAGFLLLNGIILYMPQFFPSSNRDARTLTPLEGLAMGFGGGISVLPGISSIGAATSIGSVCGVERSYGLSMALMMNMLMTAGYLVYDLIAVVSGGLAGLSFLAFVRCLVSALAAFAGTVLASRILRYFASHHGFSLFGLYSMGLALFTFILNLIA